MLLDSRDLRVAYSVCKHWNLLINNFQELNDKRIHLDVYDDIHFKFEFSTRVELEESIRPSGICIDPKTQDIFVCDYNILPIRIFNQRGKLIRQFELQESNDPAVHSSIFISSLDYVYIADVTGKKIHILRDFVGIGQIQTHNEPTCITVSRDGQLILVTTELHTVEIFSIDGRMVGEFGSFGEKIGQFQCPWGICCSSKGEVIVADKYNNRIQVFTTSGIPLRTINLETPSVPSAICLDHYDNILVTDHSNSRILILDPLGKHIKSIETEGEKELINPIGICVYRGRIYISQMEKGISVFSN